MEKLELIRTKERLVAPGAIKGLCHALNRHRVGSRLLLVCDENTWPAAGQAVAAVLEGNYTVTTHSLGRNVHPLLSHAVEIGMKTTDYDALIAIGSGTINDITKYAAAIGRKPYISIATAASMNGYISANASLTEHGAKHSYPASPPIAVIADMNIIAAAPKRLARAGFGDTLCRTTVEADMLMSHYLLDTDYPRMLFDILRAHEPGLLIHASKLRDNDPFFLGLLMSALLEAGDAMVMHGSSAPASQGEHMIAHTAEMLYGSELTHLTHGELIAATTMTMARLQHTLIENMPTIHPLPRDELHFQRLFGKAVSATLCLAYNRKFISIDRAGTINEKLARDWPHIYQELTNIMLPLNTLKRAFLQSNTPTDPRELKIINYHYQAACQHAYLTRDRFTFLDIAAMAEKRA